MDTEETFILAVGGLAILSIFYLKYIHSSVQKLTSFMYKVLMFFQNKSVQVIIGIILLEIVIYYIYKRIRDFVRGIKQKKEKIPSEKETIKKFLRTNLSSLNTEELLKLYKGFKERFFSEESLSDYREKIKNKLLKIEKRIIITEHEEDLEFIEHKKDQASQELEKINKEIYFKDLKEKGEKDRIKKRLGIGDKYVFKKERLNPKEVKLVKEEGYKAINEYCVLEKKIIPVFVKGILNHSYTHIFLVWSIERLLKRYHQISKIRIHETRDADLTFQIKNKTYALEVEIGSLLRKKQQLFEKVRDLDEEYEARWAFVVSNRNLVKKYKKFGKCVQRKQVQKIIEKWIKSQHPKF